MCLGSRMGTTLPKSIELFIKDIVREKEILLTKSFKLFSFNEVKIELFFIFLKTLMTC